MKTRETDPVITEVGRPGTESRHAPTTTWPPSSDGSASCRTRPAGSTWSTPARRIVEGSDETPAVLSAPAGKAADAARRRGFTARRAPVQS